MAVAAVLLATVVLMAVGRRPLFGHALTYCCMRGWFGAARLLLRVGAATEARDTYYGGRPLDHAVSRGNAELVRLLLARGASTGAKVPGARTPLMSAVADGSPELMDILLEGGASVLDLDSVGMSVLDHGVVAHVSATRLGLDDQAERVLACLRVLLPAYDATTYCSPLGRIVDFARRQRDGPLEDLLSRLW